jgi:hypothetical protein
MKMPGIDWRALGIAGCGRTEKSPTPDSGVGLSFAAVHDLSPLLSCVRAADGVAHDRGNAGATGSFFWLNLLGLG